MSGHIDPTIVEKAAKVWEGHYLRVAPIHCTCGWQSGTWNETDGFQRLNEHHAELVLEAAAPLIAAKALRDFADAHRLPFIVFQDEDNYPHTVNDLLRAEAEGYAKKVQS